ncbi:TPA: SGNH/GDSL hydrolase family protein [Acinetobacter baumannii]|uniref:SGNH/GDSL hydrolase family protein n=2 Tax=Acinetobacter baumannii TaxID=470 RepID=UPI0007D8641B|nr:SGNH/GDSL hydrolase family protein [Acinetobacter baumannii]OAM13634.1 acylhydrolase [Acinetobacter baumannii]
MTQLRYAALGGCNTIGEVNNIGSAYPERIAHAKGWALSNYGYTMCSTREGLQFFHHKEDIKTADIISIQYGGVDSWLTFKGSPFVLYYPDSPWRKFLRKLVKKLKKYARKFHWHRLVGTENVVPLDEYIANIQYIIEHSQAKYILLIDTYPNLDKSREPRIRQYNQALQSLSDGERVLYVPNYERLSSDEVGNYDDQTHLSSKGQQVVADAVIEVMNRIENRIES